MAGGDAADVSSRPSALCQTSPKLSCSFDQPPMTHMRPRWTAAPNQSRGDQAADSVSQVHSTPSAEDQTSFLASYCGT